MQTDTQNDDDWEYEYDDNETEDFHITLDLTTYAPASTSRKRKPDSQDPSDAHSQASVAAHTSASASAQPETFSGTDEIQLLDLHNDKPLVSYQGNLYICTWASALGTDLLFSGTDTSTPKTTTFNDSAISTSAEASRPASNPSRPATPPPQPQQSYKLHAITSLRLLAKPAIATPSPTQRLSTAPQPALPVDHRTSAYVAPHRRVQTAFLTRLAAAKRAHGDIDSVPVYTNEPNHQPPPVPAMVGGQDERRRRGGPRAKESERGVGKRTRAVCGRTDDEEEEGDEDADIEREEAEMSLANAVEREQQARNGDKEEDKWDRSNRLRRKRRWTNRFEEAMRHEAAETSDDADAGHGRGDAEYEAMEPPDEDVEAASVDEGSSSVGTQRTTGTDGQT